MAFPAAGVSTRSEGGSVWATEGCVKRRASNRAEGHMGLVNSAAIRSNFL